MIITETPLRVSFFGGGTDFREYFQRHGGCALSTAIDKYIFVTIKERFDDKIRIGYSQTEMVDSVDELEHELARECLRYTGITRTHRASRRWQIFRHVAPGRAFQRIRCSVFEAMTPYSADRQINTTLAGSWAIET